MRSPAPRRLQRGFTITTSHHRVAPGRQRRRGGRGRAAATRVGSVPLTAMTFVPTTSRAAPGGARQRGVAHVQPHGTESAQDPARHARPALPASPLRSFALACTSARKRAGLAAARPRLPQPCPGGRHWRCTPVRTRGWGGTGRGTRRLPLQLTKLFAYSIGNFVRISPRDQQIEEVS